MWGLGLCLVTVTMCFMRKLIIVFVSQMSSVSFMTVFIT